MDKAQRIILFLCVAALPPALGAEISLSSQSIKVSVKDDGIHLLSYSADLMSWVSIDRDLESSDPDVFYFPLNSSEIGNQIFIKETVVPINKIKGEWNGLTEIFQTGSCGYNGSDYGIEDNNYIFNITDDLNISVDTVFPGVGIIPNDFTGQITKDGKITLSRISGTNCSGVRSIKNYTYEGQVSIVDGMIMIEFSGDEAWCPEMGCTFYRSVTLSQPVGKN